MEGKGEIAGEGGRGGRETTLGPTVQGETAGRERKRRRRDGTDGTRRRVCACMSVYVCVRSCARAYVCVTLDHVCAMLVLVRVHGHAAWSTRIPEGCGAREHVCVPRFSISRECAGTRHPCHARACVYVEYARARAHGCMSCVCGRVRVYVNPCVGDDALQTRVKSRGGREFLCASRPVLPSPPPSAAQQPSSPR